MIIILRGSLTAGRHYIEKQIRTHACGGNLNQVPISRTRTPSINPKKGLQTYLGPVYGANQVIVNVGINWRQLKEGWRGDYIQHIRLTLHDCRIIRAIVSLYYQCLTSLLLFTSVLRLSSPHLCRPALLAYRTKSVAANRDNHCC